MIDYNRFLDAALQTEKPRQPYEFTRADVAARIGNDSRARDWLESMMKSGSLTRRRLRGLYLYRPTGAESDGQGPQETIKP